MYLYKENRSLLHLTLPTSEVRSTCVGATTAIISPNLYRSSFICVCSRCRDTLLLQSPSLYCVAFLSASIQSKIQHTAVGPTLWYYYHTVELQVIGQQTSSPQIGEDTQMKAQRLLDARRRKQSVHKVCGGRLNKSTYISQLKDRPLLINNPPP